MGIYISHSPIIWLVDGVESHQTRLVSRFWPGRSDL